MHASPVLLTIVRVGFRIHLKREQPEPGDKVVVAPLPPAQERSSQLVAAVAGRVTCPEQAAGTETGRLAGSSYLVYHRMGTMPTPSTVT